MKKPTLFREAHGSSRSPQQILPQSIFQSTDPPTHSGLRYAETLSCCADRSGLGDKGEGLKIDEVHGSESLSATVALRQPAVSYPPSCATTTTG